MSVLIMLRGNSGSGKTTIAKLLRHRLGHNVMLLQQDAVRREMLRVKDGPDTPAVLLLCELLAYGKEHCRAVILEGILRAAWYRPLFEEAVRLFGEAIFAYYYDLPFEETLRRHAAKANSADFGEREMRSWWSERDLIGFIPETLFTAEVSAERAVEIICSRLPAELFLPD